MTLIHRLILLVIVVTFCPTGSVPISNRGVRKLKMTNGNPLTTHILDTSRGRPAANVQVMLYKYDFLTEDWALVSRTRTNKDGRTENLIGTDNFTAGTYKLYFDTLSYFQGQGQKSFYPYVEVAFEVENSHEHHHVPLLISAFGYSTYRGS